MSEIDWGTVFERVLPFLTLLLGAWLARGSTRREERLTAGVELAELHKRAWRKFGVDDWVELKAYLGRLRVGLRAAGVPMRMVDPLVSATEAHWRGVYDTGDEEIGLGVASGLAADLDRHQRLVLDWLDRRWRIIRRWRAWRESGRNSEGS